jgi:large subunit ribosomal protein L6
MSLRRALHTSARRASHIGSLPILVPAGVRLGLPALSISPELPSGSPTAQRLLTVTGPLGEQILPLSPPIILDSSPDALRVSVHDSTEKRQRSLWGLTRSLINNAVKGVSEGYTLELRLVGVGYRGAVEPIPEVFIELQKQMPRIVRTSKPGAPPYHPPPLPTDRINLKLGYAHPVLIDIPAGITVTTPSPTTIVLKGLDKQKLGLFAAKIRRWRKPEPYRGKVGGPLEPWLTAGYLCRGRDHPAQRDQEEVTTGMHLSYRLHQTQALEAIFPAPPKVLGVLWLPVAVTAEDALPQLCDPVLAANDLPCLAEYGIGISGRTVDKSDRKCDLNGLNLVNSTDERGRGRHLLG